MEALNDFLQEYNRQALEYGESEKIGPIKDKYLDEERALFTLGTTSVDPLPIVPLYFLMRTNIPGFYFHSRTSAIYTKEGRYIPPKQAQAVRDVSGNPLNDYGSGTPITMPEGAKELLEMIYKKWSEANPQY